MLRVERVGAGVTIQDLGRAGRMRDGVPPGGALIPELLVAANRSLGNDASAAAIEIPLSGARFRADVPIVVSLDGSVKELAAGDEFDVRPSIRVARYVALPGGVDVPMVLGGRGTLLVAGFGGHEGRALRVGDVLRAVSGAPASASSVEIAYDEEAPIRVVAGPDAFDEVDLETLCGAPWSISPALDRVGTRLDGFRLTTRPADRRFAMPMVRGAIQVTGDGTPIVLGPDHPTTGGYPVIACVVTGDLGLFASHRPGAVIRFVAAP